jgi:16S rRNA (uracil1498-N3)-methyltransferase
MRNLQDTTFFYATFEQLGEQVNLDEEAMHLQVLRLKIGDQLWIVNGKGRLAMARLLRLDKRSAVACIESISEHESEPRWSLAMGLLKGRDPEEVVDWLSPLPIKRIQWLYTDHSQVKRGDHEGLWKKMQSRAIAGLKQSKRAWLMELPPIQSFQEWLGSLPPQTPLMTLDWNGQLAQDLDLNKPGWLVCGPEGGLSSLELESLKTAQSQLLSLGHARLRALHAPHFAFGALQGVGALGLT